MDRLRRLVRLLGLITLGAAVYTELSKEPEERTGEGLVAGIVPYDFRPPTPAKLKHALWNPDDDRLFVPTVFGVGWTINFAKLLGMVTAAR